MSHYSSIYVFLPLKGKATGAAMVVAPGGGLTHLDFNILIYPYHRPGAMNANAEPLFPVPNNAPPVFMVCADDDRSHVEPTVKFYLELEAERGYSK